MAVRGPALIVTTTLLKPAPRRIALQTRSIQIPGTYEVRKVVGAVLGAVALTVACLPLLTIFHAFYLAITTLAIGALLGIVASSWSPLRSESLTQWVLLKSAKRSGLVRAQGRYVRAYVGTCQMDRAPFGPVQTVPNSVERASAAARASSRAAAVRPEFVGRASLPMRMVPDRIAASIAARERPYRVPRRPVAPSAPPTERALRPDGRPAVTPPLPGLERRPQARKRR